MDYPGLPFTPSGINIKFTKTKNSQHMKKLLIVLVLGAFVACNESSTTESTMDSTAARMDSITDVKTDSITDRADSLVNKMDSTTDAKIDSLKK